jgi:hypothetical protein
MERNWPDRRSAFTTANSCQLPWTPLRGCVARSSSMISDPTTKSSHARGNRDLMVGEGIWVAHGSLGLDSA